MVLFDKMFVVFFWVIRLILVILVLLSVISLLLFVNLF